jgi:CysZ protein
MQTRSNTQISSQRQQWIPLTRSIFFLLSKKRLLGLSFVLFLVTVVLTWAGYHLSLEFIDDVTGNFLVNPPDTATIWGWLKHKGWVVLKWLYVFITRIVAFFLAFIIAYSLTTPGYALLSTTAEKIHAGKDFEMDEGLTVKGLLLDLYEGIKIGGFGLLVTIAALFANFIPMVGQLVVFFLYVYYSALMFVDYPASRRHWSLGKKISWLTQHNNQTVRLGILPAIVSMIPVVNIFLMALLFPFLTVHATLNFTALETSNHIQTTDQNDGS